MMGLEKAIAAVFLWGAFLFFTGINYSIIYRGRIKHETTSSLTPLLGGTAGALGVLTVAGVGRPLLILLPLLADPGCIPLFIELIVLLVKDGRRK